MILSFQARTIRIRIPPFYVKLLCEYFHTSESDATVYTQFFILPLGLPPFPLLSVSECGTILPWPEILRVIFYFFLLLFPTSTQSKGILSFIQMKALVMYYDKRKMHKE